MCVWLVSERKLLKGRHHVLRQYFFCRSLCHSIVICPQNIVNKYLLNDWREIAGVQLQQPGIQPEGVSGFGEKLRQPLSFLGLPVYFKLMILFYTFTKALGQRFDIFSSHWPRFIFLQKSLLPLKRSSFLSDSLIYFFSCVLVNTL